VMLMLIFLIPWLEGAGLRGAGSSLTRLRLDNPWTIFFILLVVAGVTNYLPTKYGPAALLLAIGFWLEFDVLTHPQRPKESRALAWSYFPLAWAAALTAAERCSRVGMMSKNRLDAFWLFFRDHWGVVWALRVQERFNRSAESLGWPIRINWQGVDHVEKRNELAQLREGEPPGEPRLRSQLREGEPPGEPMLLSQLREGEPPCEPSGLSARLEPRPPGEPRPRLRSQLREGEPPCEPSGLSARLEPRPPGITQVDPEGWDFSAAEAMLLSLLRRFVSAERIERSLQTSVERPCQKSSL